jgi:3-deoxy-manno-octulosonate cytidylyltransferase (CMP-KDO synthetase)
MADINGAPLVVHVWRRAMAAKLGHVLVAASDSPISAGVGKAGGDAIVTQKNTNSAVARVSAALALRDPGKTFQYVMVLPAIYPAIDEITLRRCLAGLTNETVDVSTIAARLYGALAASPDTLSSPDAVRVIAPLDEAREVAFVRDFQREALPATDGQAFWQHVAVSAFRREALDRFATTPASARETEQDIELLRALDMGLKVAVVSVDAFPLCVETQGSLERARVQLKPRA